MAGHIFLISCLLAVCLPIIFVQLPRFASFKEMHTEIEAETRPTVLRRRSLSPSQQRTRQMLRWIARSWSQASLGSTDAKLEQKQSSSEKTAQSSDKRRWHTGASWPIFQGDACADGGRLSKNEDAVRKARMGRKPWDPPFRRPLPKTEPTEKSGGGRWNTVATPLSLRKTGRDLDAQGLANRLFPPDPVSELDDGRKYNRRLVTSSGTSQTPYELSHRDLPPDNRPQSHGDEPGPSREQKPKLLPTLVVSTPSTDPESLPSHFDGSPPPSSYRLPRSSPPAKTKEPAGSLCRHCEHPQPVSWVPQSPSVASVPPDCNACSDLTRCHASKSGLSFLGKDTPISCKHNESTYVAPPSKSVLAQYPIKATKSAVHEPPEAITGDIFQDATEENAVHIDKENPHDPAETPRNVAPKASSKERMLLWQVLLITMGFGIFVLAFAALVAHSLAWFLVYKTEARLGELRAGLLRGGEMKLCLCGRG